METDFEIPEQKLVIEKKLVDQNDLLAVKSIVAANFGSYPIDANWSDTNGWLDQLKKRVEPTAETNREIHNYFENKYGYDSNVSMATGILATITPELTKIACAQLEGYKGPRSWRSVDRASSQILRNKIDSEIKNSSNEKFFKTNPTFKDGLLLIRDVLIPESNPSEIEKKHSEYMKKCISDNTNGKIVLFIPRESDYTHPIVNEDETTPICEASVSILLPLSADERKKFDETNKKSWSALSGRKYANKNSVPPNILVGDNLMGAGFEVLSATSGEAFTIKVNGRNENGFYFARNNVIKKQKFWELTGDLMGVAQRKEDLIPYFSLLYTLHEDGHRLFPQYGIYGEVPTDIPAVMKSIEMGPSLELDPKEMVRAIITEYVSEIIASTSGGELFDGYKADKGNNLFSGYLLSGVVIVNSLVSSGVARFSEGKISVDTSKEAIQKFNNELETVDRLFHKNDPNIKKKIRLAVLTPMAKQLVDALRNHPVPITNLTRREQLLAKSP